MKRMKSLMVLCVAVLALSSVAAKPKKAKAKKAKAAVEAPEHGVIFSGSVERNTFPIANNHQYGKNYQFMGTTGAIFPAAYKAQKGDVIKIHMVGKVDKPIIVGASISCYYGIIDTTEAAKYWTKLDSDDLSMTDAVADDLTLDAEFHIVTDSKAKAGSGGVNFILGTSDEQAEAVTLTTSEFTYEITRP